MHFAQTIKSPANDLPPFFCVGDAGLPHGSIVHAGKNAVCQLKHIRQAFFGGLTSCAEDFFAVNGILHRLELGGGAVR